MPPLNATGNALIPCMTTAIDPNCQPMRLAVNEMLLPTATPLDPITRDFLVGIRGSFPHDGMTLDKDTLTDLELFSGFGGKTLFQIIDNTRTPYGQARLWQLLERPFKDPATINERTKAVRMLVEDEELLSHFQTGLTQLYNKDVPLYRGKGRRIGIIEELIRNRTEPIFKMGKEPWSAFTIHASADVFGRYIPLTAISYFIFYAFSHIKEIQQANATNTPPTLGELFLTAFILAYLFGSIQGYPQYRKNYKPQYSNARASLVEINRLLTLAKELEKILGKKNSKTFQTLAKNFGSFRDASDPHKIRSFAEKLEKYVSTDYATRGKDRRHRIIPLDHEFIREGYGKAVTSLLFYLGDLDSICSQAEAAKRLGFSLDAEAAIQDAPLFEAKGLWHPFIENPIKNDLTLDDTLRMMVLHSLNGSGKSVVMKETAIAAILAQMGGGGPFSSLRYTPFDELITSINIHDNTAAGLSSFYSVKDRLLHISRTAEQGGKLFVGLDQIAEGDTNHLEAAATAIAFSNYLASFQNVRTISASHLDELADWVDSTNAPHIQNFHLDAKIVDGTLKYFYKLLPEKSELRAAIQILRESGFDPKIVERAEEVLARMMRNKPSG